MPTTDGTLEGRARIFVPAPPAVFAAVSAAVAAWCAAMIALTFL